MRAADAHRPGGLPGSLERRHALLCCQWTGLAGLPGDCRDRQDASANIADMQRDLDKMRRRPFFFPLVLPVLLFIAVVAAAAWVFDARATTVVFVVRHAETETGADPDPSLSVDGRERAARLARMLSQAQPVRGVDAIFASEFRRTHQTVTPLSETLALPVNLVPSATWNDLAKRITREHRGEYVLVAGSANTVPQLVKALSDTDVSLREDEYDAMFIIFVPQISKTRVVRVRY